MCLLKRWIESTCNHALMLQYSGKSFKITISMGILINKTHFVLIWKKSKYLCLPKCILYFGSCFPTYQSLIHAILYIILRKEVKILKLYFMPKMADHIRYYKVLVEFPRFIVWSKLEMCVTSQTCTLINVFYMQQDYI